MFGRNQIRLAYCGRSRAPPFRKFTTRPYIYSVSTADRCIDFESVTEEDKLFAVILAAGNAAAAILMSRRFTEWLVPEGSVPHIPTSRSESDLFKFWWKGSPHYTDFFWWNLIRSSPTIDNRQSAPARLSSVDLSAIYHLFINTQALCAWFMR